MIVSKERVAWLKVQNVLAAREFPLILISPIEYLKKYSHTDPEGLQAKEYNDVQNIMNQYKSARSKHSNKFPFTKLPLHGTVKLLRLGDYVSRRSHPREKIPRCNIHLFRRWKRRDEAFKSVVLRHLKRKGIQFHCEDWERWTESQREAYLRTFLTDNRYINILTKSRWSVVHPELSMRILHIALAKKYSVDHNRGATRSESTTGQEIIKRWRNSKTLYTTNSTLRLIDINSKSAAQGTLYEQSKITKNLYKEKLIAKDYNETLNLSKKFRDYNTKQATKLKNDKTYRKENIISSQKTKDINANDDSETKKYSNSPVNTNPIRKQQSIYISPNGLHEPWWMEGPPQGKPFPRFGEAYDTQYKKSEWSKAVQPSIKSEGFRLSRLLFMQDRWAWLREQSHILRAIARSREFIHDSNILASAHADWERFQLKWARKLPEIKKVSRDILAQEEEKEYQMNLKQVRMESANVARELISEGNRSNEMQDGIENILFETEIAEKNFRDKFNFLSKSDKTISAIELAIAGITNTNIHTQSAYQSATIDPNLTEQKTDLNVEYPLNINLSPSLEAVTRTLLNTGKNSNEGGPLGSEWVSKVKGKALLQQGGKKYLMPYQLEEIEKWETSRKLQYGKKEVSSEIWNKTDSIGKSTSETSELVFENMSPGEIIENIDLSKPSLVEDNVGISIANEYNRYKKKFIWCGDSKPTHYSNIELDKHIRIGSTLVKDNDINFEDKNRFYLKENISANDVIRRADMTTRFLYKINISSRSNRLSNKTVQVLQRDYKPALDSRPGYQRERWELPMSAMEDVPSDGELGLLQPIGNEKTTWVSIGESAKLIDEQYVTSGWGGPEVGIINQKLSGNWAKRIRGIPTVLSSPITYSEPLAESGNSIGEEDLIDRPFIMDGPELELGPPDFDSRTATRYPHTEGGMLLFTSQVQRRLTLELFRWAELIVIYNQAKMIRNNFYRSMLLWARWHKVGKEKLTGSEIYNMRTTDDDLSMKPVGNMVNRDGTGVFRQFDMARKSYDSAIEQLQSMRLKEIEDEWKKRATELNKMEYPNRSVSINDSEKNVSDFKSRLWAIRKKQQEDTQISNSDIEKGEGLKIVDEIEKTENLPSEIISSIAQLEMELSSDILDQSTTGRINLSDNISENKIKEQVLLDSDESISDSSYTPPEGSMLSFITGLKTLENIDYNELWIVPKLQKSTITKYQKKFNHDIVTDKTSDLEQENTSSKILNISQNYIIDKSKLISENHKSMKSVNNYSSKRLSDLNIVENESKKKTYIDKNEKSTNLFNSNQCNIEIDNDKKSNLMKKFDNTDISISSDSQTYVKNLSNLDNTSKKISTKINSITDSNKVILKNKDVAKQLKESTIYTENNIFDPQNLYEAAAYSLARLRSERIDDLINRPFFVKKNPNITGPWEQPPGKPESWYNQTSNYLSTLEKVRIVNAQQGPITPWESLQRMIRELEAVDRLPKIHPHINISTETGRLASRRPNIQNQPKNIDGGTRGCLQAEPGNILLAADYSALEVRIIAHHFTVSSMVEMFGQDVDMHTLFARTLNGYFWWAMRSGCGTLGLPEAIQYLVPQEKRELLGYAGRKRNAMRQLGLISSIEPSLYEPETGTINLQAAKDAIESNINEYSRNNNNKAVLQYSHPQLNSAFHISGKIKKLVIDEDDNFRRYKQLKENKVSHRTTAELQTTDSLRLQAMAGTEFNTNWWLNSERKHKINDIPLKANIIPYTAYITIKPWKGIVEDSKISHVMKYLSHKNRLFKDKTKSIFHQFAVETSKTDEQKKLSTLRKRKRQQLKIKSLTQDSSIFLTHISKPISIDTNVENNYRVGERTSGVIIPLEKLPFSTLLFIAQNPHKSSYWVSQYVIGAPCSYKNWSRHDRSKRSTFGHERWLKMKAIRIRELAHGINKATRQKNRMIRLKTIGDWKHLSQSEISRFFLDDLSPNKDTRNKPVDVFIRPKDQQVKVLSTHANSIWKIENPSKIKYQNYNDKNSSHISVGKLKSSEDDMLNKNSLVEKNIFNISSREDEEKISITEYMKNGYIKDNTSNTLIEKNKQKTLYAKSLYSSSMINYSDSEGILKSRLNTETDSKVYNGLSEETQNSSIAINRNNMNEKILLKNTQTSTNINNSYTLTNKNNSNKLNTLSVFNDGYIVRIPVPYVRRPRKKFNAEVKIKTLSIIEDIKHDSKYGTRRLAYNLKNKYKFSFNKAYRWWRILTADKEGSKNSELLRNWATATISWIPVIRFNIRKRRGLYKSIPRERKEYLRLVNIYPSEAATFAYELLKYKYNTKVVWKNLLQQLTQNCRHGTVFDEGSSNPDMYRFTPDPNARAGHLSHTLYREKINQWEYESQKNDVRSVPLREFILVPKFDFTDVIKRASNIKALKLLNRVEELESK